MSEQRTLWLADQLLANDTGHHAGFNKALAAAAERAGWVVRIAGQQDAQAGLVGPRRLEGVFRRDWRASPPVWAARSPRLLAWIERIAATRFEVDLRRGFKGVRVSDAIFAQMLAPRHLLGWLRWHGCCRDVPFLVLHLGYAPERFVSYPGLKAAVESVGDRCVFASDSERLCPRYGEILGRNVMHLPHVIPDGTPQPHIRTGEAMPTVLVLGNPRREKGFIEMATAALQATGLHFIFQTGNAEACCRKSVDDLRAAAGGRMQVIDSHLGDSEYFELIRNCDVVAVPYHLDVYRDRTSGILCEALAAGKPVITTVDSWMSTQFEGCGWLVGDRKVRDLQHAMEIIPAELPKMSRRAREMAPEFRSKFGGNRFMALFGEIVRDA